MTTDPVRRVHGPRRANRLFTLGSFAFLIVAGWLLWGRTLGHEFVWDDNDFIVRNAALRSWTFLPQYFTSVDTMAGGSFADQFLVFRPLRNVSYRLDFAVAGLNPRWWHATNVWLHVLNALLLYLIARTLMTGPLAPLFAASIFLLHPVQSEVVCWIKARDDLLAAAFSLGLILVWVRWRSPARSRAKMAALALLYLGACLSKIQAIVLPIVLLALELWMPSWTEAQRRGGESSDSGGEDPRVARRGALTWVPLFGATALAVLLWRHLFLGQTAQTEYLAGGFLPTMLTMTRAGVQYVRLLVFPMDLLADYSGMESSQSFAEPRVWLSGVLLAAIAGAIIAARRKFPLESTGWLLVIVFLLPVSNVVPTMQYLAERFLYLPMIGFALFAGGAAVRLESRSRPAAVVAAALLLTVYGARSTLRVQDWRDGATLFEATVRDSPETNLRARRNLLVERLRLKQYDKAEPLARRLLELEISRGSSIRKVAEATRHLGIIYQGTGRSEEGAQHLRRALAIDASYMQPSMDLGIVEGGAGRHGEALAWFDRAAKADPTEPMAHFNRGISLRELGRADEAEQAFLSAIRNAPSTAQAHLSLAALYWKREAIEQAAEVYRAANRIWPGNAEIQHWLEQSERILSGGEGQ